MCFLLSFPSVRSCHTITCMVLQGKLASQRSELSTCSRTLQTNRKYSQMPVIRGPVKLIEKWLFVFSRHAFCVLSLCRKTAQCNENIPVCLCLDGSGQEEMEAQNGPHDPSHRRKDQKSSQVHWAIINYASSFGQLVFKASHGMNVCVFAPVCGAGHDAQWRRFGWWGKNKKESWKKEGQKESK